MTDEEAVSKVLHRRGITESYGCTRACGGTAICIARNGSGVADFATAIETADWDHPPMLPVTPQAADRTVGRGGFREIARMAVSEDSVAHQGGVRGPARIAEAPDRVIADACRGSTSAQINLPRDDWTRVIDVGLSEPVALQRFSVGHGAMA